MEQLVKQKKLNLGFAGVGWIGFNRLKSVMSNNNANVALIYEPSDTAAKNVLSIAHTAERAESYIDLITNKNIDGVVIATPNYLHVSQTIAALNKDLPVFCQKPLGKNANETLEILSTAKANNKSLEVDYSYRKTKAFESMLTAVNQGELGEIYAVDLIFHNAYGPDKQWCFDYDMSGGGCLIDLGIHLIDMALLVLKFSDVTVLDSTLYSNGKIILPSQNLVEDYASAKVRTNKNVLIDIKCSWNLNIGKGAEIKVQLFGTKASAIFQNINGSFYEFRSDLLKGDKSYELFSGFDDWSSRGISDWISLICEDNSFNDSSLIYLQSAEVIDKIYERL